MFAAPFLCRLYTGGGRGRAPPAWRKVTVLFSASSGAGGEEVLLGRPSTGLSPTWHLLGELVVETVRPCHPRACRGLF